MLKRRDPSKLRIKHLKRFKDTRTKAEVVGRTIRVIPTTTKGEIAHEEGHYVLGHDTYKIPRKSSVYARHEVDANVYAHKKCNQPKGMKSKLRGIYNDLTVYEYKTKPKTATRYVEKAINRKEVPLQYKRDWKSIKKEIREVYGAEAVGI